jgi:SAM-dependent methyltransferase
VDYAYGAVAAAAGARRAHALPVAADALSLPFAPRSFAAVVSQFGLEYAGLRAFAEAARVVAKGGHFAACVHMKGGGLAEECAEHLRLLDAFAETGLAATVRRSLSASRGQPSDAAPGPLSHADAAVAAKRVLTEAPASAAKATLLRFLDDLHRLIERRRHYDPRDATGWIDVMEARLADYRRRMAAMLDAARDADDLAKVRSLLSAEGLSEFQQSSIVPREGLPPAAWWIEARRP